MAADDRTATSDYLQRGLQSTVGAALMSPIASQIVEAELAPFLASKKRARDIARGPGDLHDRLKFSDYLGQNKVARDVPYRVEYGSSPGIISDTFRTEDKRPFIRQNTRGIPYLLHEAGHQDAKNPISKARMNMLSWAQREVPEMKGVKGYATRRGVHVADALMAPIDEAVAWRNAYKRASTIPGASGSRMRRMMAKIAAPSYLSNLPRAGMVGLGGYLLGDALLGGSDPDSEASGGPPIYETLGSIGSAATGAYLASRRGDNMVNKIQKNAGLSEPRPKSDFVLSSFRSGQKPLGRVARGVAPLGGALLGGYLFKKLTEN